MTSTQVQEVTIDKLVHGGQGLGTLSDGKKALVWNVLPGETVRFVPRRSKSSYVEGVAEEIIKPSNEREMPRDELYLSTSPWQMMNYVAENRYKREILAETLQRAGIEYTSNVDFVAPDKQWHYRNKMEYSFWGDDDGLHLALYNRGTHRKQIVTGSSIARAEIDNAANEIRAVLNEHQIRAGDLKSLIIRCNQAGECVAALFTRNEKFPLINKLKGVCKGIVVCFSNPKSPASVRTKDLYTFGGIALEDTIGDSSIKYDVFSFFQINVPIFQQAVKAIAQKIESDEAVDFYGGVGAISSAIPNTRVVVDSDPHSIEWARQNFAAKDAEVVLASAEKALGYIQVDRVLIVDPPRAGLHADVSEQILSVEPPLIMYLSCNPSTLARDLKLLSARYKISQLTGYNFFPRTPHIEALAILERV